MNAPAALDLASIPERIQSEVQRAIQRSIKGVEYLSTSGPSLGSTPKDILHARGTMNLYHYRPVADEIYRVPILIVMATTNRGYILDLVPGQSFIEFLSSAATTSTCSTGPRRSRKRRACGWRTTSSISSPIAFAACSRIPASGCQRHRLLFRRRAVAAVRLDLPRRADEELICFTTPIDFREMKLFSNFSDRAIRRRPSHRCRRQCAAEMILSSFEMLRPASRAAGQVQLWRTSGTMNS